MECKLLILTVVLFLSSAEAGWKPGRNSLDACHVAKEGAEDRGSATSRWWAVPEGGAVKGVCFINCFILRGGACTKSGLKAEPLVKADGKKYAEGSTWPSGYGPEVSGLCEGAGDCSGFYHGQMMEDGTKEGVCHIEDGGKKCVVMELEKVSKKADPYKEVGDALKNYKGKSAGIIPWATKEKNDAANADAEAKAKKAAEEAQAAADAKKAADKKQAKADNAALKKQQKDASKKLTAGGSAGKKMFFRRKNSNIRRQ